VTQAAYTYAAMVSYFLSRSIFNEQVEVDPAEDVRLARNREFDT
jgi:hypothetical protein